MKKGYKEEKESSKKTKPFKKGYQFGKKKDDEKKEK